MLKLNVELLQMLLMQLLLLMLPLLLMLLWMLMLLGMLMLLVMLLLMPLVMVVEWDRFWMQAGRGSDCRQDTAERGQGATQICQIVHRNWQIRKRITPHLDICAT